MKTSPFDRVFEQLKQDLLEISIAQWLLKRKMEKAADAVDKAIAELEEPYKVDEFQSHIPQNLMIQMLDYYKQDFDNSTGVVPNDLVLEDFANSDKGEKIFSALDKTTALTDEEKIKILNEFGAVEGLNYKQKLTEKGLTDYLAQFKSDFKGEIVKDASKFECEAYSSIPFANLKEFFNNLIPFMDKKSLDTELIKQSLDEMTSKEWLASIKNKSTTNAYINLLSKNLTQEQELKLSREKLAIKYEDPDQLKGPRSILTISAYEKEKFSILTTIDQARDEQFTAGKKIVQEADREYGVIRKMPKDFHRTLKIAGEEYAYSDFVTKEAIALEQKNSQKLLDKTELARLERNNAIQTKAVGNMQKQLITAINNGNLDTAYQILEHPGSYISAAAPFNKELASSIENAIGDRKDDEDIKPIRQDFLTKLKQFEEEKEQYKNDPVKMKLAHRTQEFKYRDTERAIDDLKSNEIKQEIISKENEINKLKNLEKSTQDVNEQGKYQEIIKNAEIQLDQMKRSDFRKNLTIHISRTVRSKPELAKSQPKQKESEARVRTKES